MSDTGLELPLFVREPSLCMGETCASFQSWGREPDWIELLKKRERETFGQLRSTLTFIWSGLLSLLALSLLNFLLSVSWRIVKSSSRFCRLVSTTSWSEPIMSGSCVV